MIFKWNFAGVEVEFHCSSMSTAGTAENPAGGGTGKLSNVSLAFGGCSANRGCTLKGGGFESKTLTGLPSEKSGERLIKYEPSSGSTFAEITFEKCEAPTLNGTKAVTGSLTAVKQAEGANKYGFDKTHGSLAISGYALTLTGTYRLYTNAGSEFYAAPESGVQYWFSEEYVENTEALKEATPTAFSSTAISFNLTFSPYGAKTTISCPSGVSGLGGVVENPSGGGAGTLTGAFTFGSCTVTTAIGSGCTLEPGGKTPFQSAELAGSATEAGKSRLVDLSPGKGGVFAKFTLQGCSLGLLNNTYSLEGTGIRLTAGAVGSFPLSANGLAMNGFGATIAGEVEVATESGQTLTLQ
jgi:hypothetical protein